MNLIKANLFPFQTSRANSTTLAQMGNNQFVLSSQMNSWTMCQYNFYKFFLIIIYEQRLFLERTTARCLSTSHLRSVFPFASVFLFACASEFEIIFNKPRRFMIFPFLLRSFLRWRWAYLQSENLSAYENIHKYHCLCCIESKFLLAIPLRKWKAAFPENRIEETFSD